MKKAKYYYNPSTLRFEKIDLPFSKVLLRVFGFLCAAIVFGFIIVLIAYSVLDSPKEKFLKNEISQMELEYDLVNLKLDTLSLVLDELRKRDDNIYRVIFEAEPISEYERMAGIGGSERFKRLNKLDNGELVKRSWIKVGQIKRQLVAQSMSYDEISELVRQKEDLLAHMPAIQPISNIELTRIASGYGYRIHPIFKTPKMHEGIDFTAPTGTPIHATADGVITHSGNSRSGYGNLVEVTHGFGYVTRYAHLSKFAVKKGQKIKRGEVIGYVGSTGLSTAPHLHYEVIKDGHKIDPVNFFYNDLTDEEYTMVIELANQSNQSFD